LDPINVGAGEANDLSV